MGRDLNHEALYKDIIYFSDSNNLVLTFLVLLPLRGG